MSRQYAFGLAAVTVIFTIVTIVVYVRADKNTTHSQGYRVETVSRGPISSVIAASGSLKAVVTVDVGTEISGTIESLSADFNSKVETGQVIARIDPALHEARLTQAEAELAVAHANLGMQEASLDELNAQLDGHRAALVQAQEELGRTRSLHSTGGTSSSVLDAALLKYQQTNAEVVAALARVARQQAQIDRARAEVRQGKAAVQQRRIDLDHTYIRSPIDGIVISRNVNVGQTVSTSFEAPVLFRIAQDLSVMEVEINVDEADIGMVRTNQIVYFTVDAFPNRRYEGRVRQIRRAGHEISNVVTYTVVATAENPDESLLPKMTANANIVIDARHDVLKIPIEAVYFRLHNQEQSVDKDMETVWVLDDIGSPRSVPVVLGLSDGIDIEIMQGEIEPGQEVIVGLNGPPSSGSNL